MAGTITHSWNGTILTIESDSGISSMDLKGGPGDIGPRGPQGPAGVIINPDGSINFNGYATEQYVEDRLAGIEMGDVNLDNYYTKQETLALIPNTSDFATKAYVDQAIEAIEVNPEDVDLTDYYTKNEVNALIPDVSGFTTMAAVEAKGYQTAAQVQAAINSSLAALDGDEVRY